MAEFFLGTTGKPVDMLEEHKQNDLKKSAMRFLEVTNNKQVQVGCCRGHPV